MAGDDFLDFSGFEAQITALISDLNKAVGDVNNASAGAAYNAAEIIRAEQARLLAKAVFKRDRKRHSYHYADGNLIKVTRDKQSAGKVFKLHIGYDTETLRQYPELLVIEFGRPGKSAKRSKPTDSRGRKKGDFPPQISHIRAGLFLAKEKAVKEFNENLYEIAKRDFTG